MKLPELMNQIKENKVQPYYIFTGEEVAIRDIYIQKIADTSGLPIVRADSLKSVMHRITNKSMLTTANVYVITDDKEYLKEDKIWKEFEEGKRQQENIIIMVYNQIDKRSKFYKQCKNSFTEFAKLSSRVLAGYIKNDIGLDTNMGLQLAEQCENNYSIIKLECDKINHLAKANEISIEQAYGIAVREDIVYTPPKDNVFELVNAICDRYPSRSFKLGEEYIEVDGGPFGVITLLYTNMRAMLLVQGAAGSKNISETTGLTNGQIYGASQRTNKYTMQELVYNIRLIRETEKKIKIGELDVAMALPYLIAAVV